MFTGLITDVGQVTAVERRGDTRFTIATGFDLDTVAIGASIACNGVCLTVVEKGHDGGQGGGGQGWFKVDVSAETHSKTTTGTWQAGTPVNLERSLRLGDELGGHLVYGHVDGVIDIVDVQPDGDSQRWWFDAPPHLARFIAAKGSVALDGVSLTVNSVEGTRFGINIIPHTQEKTTFQHLKAGGVINLEVDMLARYVARLAETK
ncbi:Riboflavin synthase alpha chain [Nitrospirillum viridazoti Y2]|uniref:Riboflavin synthase n=1 Tax=Nitrospirillum amazonense TaxID=28077 RepID=A0A560IXI2_9PROT|nr:riboflavin synthase [Nitrospirillum amazonense]EGY00214.1 Riboflavin synthase alpha chain [Nitrospirillum amazonense Y2]TWB63753.1 riboflavin synthase alpha chain [Nitrospirillum amazonense]